MAYLRKVPVLGTICAALLLVAPFAWSEATAQTASVPSSIEREYWEATRQIDSVAGYQAYLAKFPNGFYALLASAAIKKAESSVPAPSTTKAKPAEGHGDSPSSTAKVLLSSAKIAGPTKSNAITQQAGDVFRGPGPITVGWSGARKQVVVPKGDWVLLAAEDAISSPATAFGSLTNAGGTTLAQPMAVTTVILARLEGPLVGSFLLARFNSKGGSPRFAWADAMACGSTSSTAAFAWRERSLWINQCIEATLHAQTQTSMAKNFSGTIWEEALQKLAAVGGALPSSPYLVTDMYYTGDSSNYLKISRIDFGVSSEQGNPAAPGSSLDLSLAGREQWARAYSELAVEGYRQRLTDRELESGGSPTMSAESLRD